MKWRRKNHGQLSSADSAAIQMMQGSSFGDGSEVTLPSGRTISGDEMQVLVNLVDPTDIAPRPQAPIGDETEHERHIRIEREKRAGEERARRSESSRMKEQRVNALKFLRPASVSDYVQFLEGYLATGGKFTHFYDYDFPTRFYVARQSVSLGNLYGAASLDVIVPKGVDVQAGGHCNLFYMESYSTDKQWWVPSYNNLPKSLYAKGQS